MGAQQAGYMNESARISGSYDPSSIKAGNVMYQAFYNLQEKPFSLIPDPHYLYTSGKHRKALVKLRSGIMNRAGTTLITGEVGSGKTTLIQHLVRNLENNEVVIGLIDNVHPRFDNLLQWILRAFDIEVTTANDVKLHQAFVRFVEAQAAQQRSAVLFIDEAQNMTGQLLEELRVLMNVNVADAFFQTVLVGQPEIRDILRRSDMRQFAQRVAVEHHLEPLDGQETQEYIQHRLHVAGGDAELFSADACRLVFERSRGIPRLINSLCDTVLEFGFEEKKAVIDATLVNDIIGNTSHAPLLAFTTDESVAAAPRERAIHAKADNSGHGAKTDSEKSREQAGQAGVEGCKALDEPGSGGFEDVLTRLARALD
jgi:type II secretory pathway predicted ATPase ExeA